MNRKPWTPDEIDALRRLYPDHTAEVVGKVIGRLPGSVHRKAASLGLEKSEAFKSSTRSGRIQRGRKDPRMLATQFKPGITPWNKGTNYVAGGRSAETRFKKGTKLYTHPAPQQADRQRVPQAFTDWLCREMPPGTIISDPAWWAPKIARAMLAAAPEQPAPAAIHPSDLKWLQKQPERDEGSHIVYDTEDIDDLTCRLTGDEGEDDSVTVLQRLAFAVENRRPGKTVYDLLDEMDAADETKKARQPAQQPLTDEQALSCIPQIRKPGTDTMVPMVWMQQRDAIQAIRSAERAHGITKGDAS